MPLNFPDDWGVRRTWKELHSDKFNVGDRVIHFKYGTGTIKYIVDTFPLSCLVVFDKPFTEGHDGAIGCDIANLPPLPEYKNRCYWVKKKDLTRESIMKRPKKIVFGDYECKNCHHLIDEDSDEIVHGLDGEVVGFICHVCSTYGRV